MIRVYDAVTPAIAGGAASATIAFCGRVLSVGVKYSGTPSGAWSATIKHILKGAAATIDEPLLTVAAAVNKVYVPMKLAQDSAGADTAATRTYSVANGQIAFAITGGPNGQTVSFQVFVED